MGQNKARRIGPCGPIMRKAVPTSALVLGAGLRNKHGPSTGKYGPVSGRLCECGDLRILQLGTGPENLVLFPLQKFIRDLSNDIFKKLSTQQSLRWIYTISKILERKE